MNSHRRILSLWRKQQACNISCYRGTHIVLINMDSSDNQNKADDLDIRLGDALGVPRKYRYQYKPLSKGNFHCLSRLSTKLDMRHLNMRHNDGYQNCYAYEH